MRRVDGLAIHQNGNRHVQALIVPVNGLRDVGEVPVGMDGDLLLAGRGPHGPRLFDVAVLRKQQRVVGIDSASTEARSRQTPSASYDLPPGPRRVHRLPADPPMTAPAR